VTDSLPSFEHVLVLLLGGVFAGVVNTLAGGGSFLTVPLLVMVGLPPTVANATNRVGVLFQSFAALGGFRQEGVAGFGSAAAVLPATLLGSWLGSVFASRVSDEVFGPLFGVIMLAALPIILMNPKPRDAPHAPRPSALQHLVYFGVGLYGGAIQAGIGIPLLLALVSLGGLDLVRGNQVKVALVGALTMVALAQFVYAGKVVWSYGLILALGTSVGAYASSRVGARVGPKLIRPVLALAVIGLSLRLLFGG
jgi:uncharacterized membrane protein YfcA